ncbi:MAG: hypothetical protein RBG13Loki_2748 [Promethearchaeota archaeon CR_4]|nr:MAG: hypothetical protein RBG13Loki_2748 [Candidatus Lokiarchaeota archaeon CR_4]
MVKPRKKPRKVWTYCPPKVPKPKVPDTVKSEVEDQTQTLITSYLKPTYILPPSPGSDSNYLVDISARWYRNYFYFYSKYSCPGPHAIAPYFEMGFARMEYLATGCFNLAYMRYTGQWWAFAANLSLEECLSMIKNGSWFHP